jgi:predicted permease
MQVLRAFWMRIFGAGKLRAEFEAELQSHIELHIEDGVRAGLSREEARRLALIRLGGAEQTRQAYRDRASVPMGAHIAQDIRFALRQMRSAPGFAITAVLTLALGIGANTVIYTLVDSILLRPLPYAHQDRLMRIEGDTIPASPKGWIRALGANSASFSSIAGYGDDAEYNVADSGIPDRLFGSSATVNAFDALGIHPAAGEFFTSDDAIAGRDNSVVISYGLWKQRFNGDPLAIGRTMRIDGVTRRILGVMPSGVHFPFADTQFVVPVSFRADQPMDPWTVFDLHVFGRLADGVTPAQAQADLRRLHRQLLPLFPWRMPDVWASDMTVVPLLEAQTGSMRSRLLLLFGAVGLIHLIACANVANLMLARATARERELAVRGALGASVRRLIQQLLTESIVLGLAAGAVAIFASMVTLRLFVGLLPADTPRIQDVALRPGDILFTLGASVLAGVLFGIIPAIKMATLNLLSTLRLGSRALMGSGSLLSISTILVMCQIGLSVVVIVGAGLMLHSLYELSRVDPGFRTAGTVTAEIALDKNACQTKGQCAVFYQSILDRASGIAGVEGAAVTQALPLSSLENNNVYDAENHPRDARQGALLATGRTVSPGYFDVLGLRLMRGRLLEQQDASGATHAAVINERMAHRLWPDQDPLGRHLLDVNDAPAPAVWDPTRASVVVGVVRNAHESSLAAAFDDEVYLPMTAGREQAVMYILLRSRLTPEEIAGELRRAVAGIDSLVPVTHVRSMNEVVAGSVSAPRALATLLLGFGGLAVFIGAVGVYSLIAYTVSWRRREFGLRFALGAQKWRILSSILGKSLTLAAGGCVLGLLAAWSLSRALKSFLFEVSAVDPLTYTLVPVLMLTVAVVAAFIPARRAAAVDPMEALRAE